MNKGTTAMARILSSLLLGLCLVGGNASALKIYNQLEKSYELTLAGIILPNSTAGTVIFKPCDTCDTTSLQVDSKTRYFIDGKEYAFADFLRAAQNMQQNVDKSSRTAATIHYWIENQRVSRLMVQDRPL
jgi:hypothetical protein